MKQKRFQWVWPALLALQLAVLALLTLTTPWERLSDPDAAKVYRHVVEMWRNGTVVIPGWKQITTLELDCAALLALPLYGLTGSIGLSFQLADLVCLAAVTALVMGLMRHAGSGWSAACMAAVLVVLPYTMGELDYWNMLYLNAAQYTVKLMVPLLLIYLLVPCPRRRRADWLILLVFCGLNLCTTFSSGIYVAVCGLLPVLLYLVWRWIHGQPLSRWQAVCGALAVGSGTAGLVLARLLDVTAKGDSMSLLGYDELAENAANLVQGLFRLLGAALDNGPDVFSLAGIGQLLAVVLLAALMWAFAVSLRPSLCVQGDPLCGYVVMLSLWNLVILLLTDSRYGAPVFETRYLLLPVVPLFLVLCRRWEALPAPAQPRLGAVQRCAPVLLVLALGIALNLQRVADCRRGVEQANASVELAAHLEQLPVDNVCVVYESGVAEICSAIDLQRNYVTLDEGRLIIHDNYLACTDATAFEGPCALVLDPELTPLETLAPCVQAACRYEGTAGGYEVYLCDSLPVDGVTGLICGDRMVDFPDSPHYTCYGEVDNDRRLHTSTGGYVLFSSELVFSDYTDVTLYYQVDVPGGLLELYSGGEYPIWIGEIDPEGDSLSISGVGPGSYTLRVGMPQDAQGTFGPIEFVRTAANQQKTF